MILDKIEHELKTNELKNIVNEYIEGVKINRIECATCHNVSENKEPFLDISVNIDTTPASTASE